MKNSGIWMKKGYFGSLSILSLWMEKNVILFTHSLGAFGERAESAPSLASAEWHLLTGNGLPCVH